MRNQEIFGWLKPGTAFKLEQGGATHFVSDDGRAFTYDNGGGARVWKEIHSTTPVQVVVA